MDAMQEKLAEAAIDKYKFLILLIGIPLLIAFVRSIVVDLLVKDARREGEKAQLKDEEIAKREQAARDAANEIINRVSEKLNTKPVTKDWYKE